MAEFQEVMKQIARMCAQQKNNCEGCLLYDDEIECAVEGPPEDWKLSRFTEIERIVSKWAAEHPEPVYPSWNEAWRQMFPDTVEKSPPCLRYFVNDARFHESCVFDMSCEDCRNKPIPADIAKKLGIKPMEDNDEQDRNGN